MATSFVDIRIIPGSFVLGVWGQPQHHMNRRALPRCWELYSSATAGIPCRVKNFRPPGGNELHRLPSGHRRHKQPTSWLSPLFAGEVQHRR